MYNRNYKNTYFILVVGFRVEQGKMLVIPKRFPKSLGYFRSSINIYLTLTKIVNIKLTVILIHYKNNHNL